MAIVETDLPGIVVERLEAYYPAPAIFTADEIADWPNGALDSFEAAGLLQSADRAEFVMCDGCHLCCFKQVVFRKPKAGARAFIVCDEEPDFGRIGVAIERLQQYRSTLRLLAQFLRNSLELTALAPLTGLPPLLLGRTKGRHGDHSVSILFHDDKIILQIGSHTGSVAEFLEFRQGQMTADKALLRKLANRKHSVSGTRPRYQPGRAKQQIRAEKTAQRDRAILAEALRIQKQTGKKFTEISRQLARSGRFSETAEGQKQPLTDKRIYRIIYDERKKLGANFSAQITPLQPPD